VAEFDILDTLAAREGLTQQNLADALLATKGNMTHHVRSSLGFYRSSTAHNHEQAVLVVTTGGPSRGT
jgi:hypothetical protein